MPSLALVLPPNGQQLASPTMYPNLGVMYIAAVAEQLGVEVRVADMRGLKEVDLGLVPEADFVGVTATSGEAGYARDIAQWVWARSPETYLIVGGAHASLAPQDMTADFDTVVVGEGERILPDILHNKLRGILRTSRITDLDSLPFPARHLFDCFSDSLFPGEKYGKGPKATTVLFSRGCPNHCSYCANIHKALVSYRSPQNIAAELEMLRDSYGCSAFRVEDDNLGYKRSWLRAVMEAIPPGLRLKGHTRADLVDDELCSMLKMGGFEEIGLGIEACDDRVLRLVEKGITEQDCYYAVHTLKRHGLRVRVYFMAGLPGETEETIQKNMVFMKETQPSKWTLSVTAPYPGSELARNPHKFGARILSQDPSACWNFAGSILELDTATNAEIMERHDRFRRFLEGEELSEDL